MASSCSCLPSFWPFASHHTSQRPHEKLSSSDQPTQPLWYFPQERSDIFQSYDFPGKEVGRGAVGLVCPCVDRQTGETLICRTILKLKNRKSPQQDVHREVRALRELCGHPNIIGLKDLYEDYQYVHLLEENCEGRTLKQELQQIEGGKLQENKAREVFRQVVHAVSACHIRGWAHRDITASNIMICSTRSGNVAQRQSSVVHEAKQQQQRQLWSEASAQTSCSSAAACKSECESEEAEPLTATLSAVCRADVCTPPELRLRNSSFGAATDATEREVKLGGFSFAVNIAEDGEVIGEAGSICHMAPEVLRRRPYGLQSDMWSLGVLLYQMLSGTLPFTGDESNRIEGQIIRGIVNFDSVRWRSVSPEAIGIIRVLLQVNPRKRPTAEELLRHPWLVEPEEVNGTREVVAGEGASLVQEKARKVALTSADQRRRAENVVPENLRRLLQRSGRKASPRRMEMVQGRRGRAQGRRG
eukprot:TRINITY_DN23840_c0_g1_i1.p1 TRINITY_DN23840_c0_g1~~TRINITY_DN23840_c0_g1_i1.p1  ORF type:complete len:473 (+),score=54.52 TRINITY_DN23840_c0_g1_i1:280-1698(+)